MTQQPPMTDLERQRILDLEAEARKVAREYDNVYIAPVGIFHDDPFTYTKELLTALCQATGRPIPSDEEIQDIVERAEKDIDKTL